MLNLAWERQPPGYRGLCEHLSERMGAVDRLGVRKKISPQNRRVRFAADLHLCREIEQPERPKSRQQKRWEKRHG